MKEFIVYFVAALTVAAVWVLCDQLRRMVTRQREAEHRREEFRRRWRE